MEPLNIFRATILNTFQAVVAFKFSKSLRFIKDLFSRKSLNGIIAELFNPIQSDELKALSAAFGVFMGIIPIWGFQTIAAIFVAVTLKLNKTLVGIFLLISVPPILPLIIILSYRFGAYWIVNPAANENISRRVEQYIYGSLSLAIVSAIVTGLLAFLLLKFIRAIKQFKLTTP
jgi:uncharacterized protein (DUF2062 family)